jgi:hypothetical protein
MSDKKEAQQAKVTKEGEGLNARYLFDCPHCGGLVEVLEGDICCKIFRHSKSIGPHASEQECIKQNIVSTINKTDGCAMPFRFDGRTVQKCGFI